MRVAITLFFFTVGYLSAEGQGKQMIAGDKLIGVWQLNDTLIGSGLGKCIRFYNDGKFEIDYSQYDYLGRIREVHGHYHKKNGQLELIAEYRMEEFGGVVVAGSPGFQTEEFVMEGGGIQKIKQKPESVLLKVEILNMDRNKQPMTIKIGNNKYCKLSDDPNKHKG